MEKPVKKLPLKHFSHEHLLEHTRALPPKGYSICFGCKLDILPGKRYYKCKTCPFFLHQVCYNMPQQVQHPIDSRHQLILLAMPSSIDKYSIECKACLQNINGFYYNCARCGSFYHALCLATPLSVKLPVHPHTLQLELSPPYDFQCDLCDLPSYRGWLYRCGLCEFDAHVSCALMDRQAKLQTPPKTEHFGVEGRTNADTDRKDNELMELLSRGMKGNEEKSSKENFQKQSHAQDQATPIGEDKMTPSYQYTPSHQFSDACFSIDFAKSFRDDDQASREADFQQLQVLGSKEARPIGYVLVPKGFVGDLMQTNPTFDVSRTPSSDSHPKSAKTDPNFVISTAVGSHVWAEIGQENPVNKVKSSNDDEGASNQTEKSHSARSRCSCW